VEKWAQENAPEFRARGAAPGFDLQLARLVASLFVAGLNPRPARIWSSGQHQEELQRKYDDLAKQAGKPAGYAGKLPGFNARPADHSKHTDVDIHGSPAATAADIDTDDPVKAGKIAESLGLGNGLKFKKPDPSHYYALT